MALPPAEIRRRIVAARTLVGMSQETMALRGHEDFGLDKHELARVERGKLQPQPFHLKVASEVLDVPMSWFTEPREIIVARQPSDYLNVLAELVAIITRSDVHVPGLDDEASNSQ